MIYMSTHCIPLKLIQSFLSSFLPSVRALGIGQHLRRAPQRIHKSRTRSRKSYACNIFAEMPFSRFFYFWYCCCAVSPSSDLVWNSEIRSAGSPPKFVQSFVWCFSQTNRARVSAFGNAPKKYRMIQNVFNAFMNISDTNLHMVWMCFRMKHKRKGMTLRESKWSRTLGERSLGRFCYFRAASNCAARYTLSGALWVTDMCFLNPPVHLESYQGASEWLTFLVEEFSEISI